MAQAEELGDTEEDKHPEKSKYCHPGYLASLPGFLRMINIVSLNHGKLDQQDTY